MDLSFNFIPALRRFARLLALSGLTFSLSGCGPSDTAESGPTSQPPQTWAEYVAEETPIREANFHPNINVYFRDGLPDMRGWKPADFLPEEYLNTPQIDACDLPPEDYEKLSPILSNQHANKELLPLALHYAEEGVIQAQAAMGWYCTLSQTPEETGITVEEALPWVQKAAASGDAFAMRMLGQCLHNIRMRDDLRHDSFRTDEELYWYWRAAEELSGPALLRLSLSIGSENFTYETQSQDFQQEYVWHRLMDLANLFGDVDPWIRDTLNRADTLRDHYNSGLKEDSPLWITEKHEQQAKAMLADWLRARPEVFAKFAESRACPENRDDLNYDAVNRELVPLGLHIVPPGHLREGPAPE